MKLHDLIIKIGHVKTVIIITVFSIVLSFTITLTSIVFTPQQSLENDIKWAYVISIIVPILVAPISSWHLVSLLIKTHQLEETTRELATYDSLTGLLNRRVFMERANYYFHVAKRTNQTFSVIMLDLDYFKTINDRYSHAAGDKVLNSVGRLFTATVRVSDLAGRIGGEEFAFLLPNTPNSQAQNLAERLHDVIRENPTMHNDLKIWCTASIGLISYPESPTEGFEELLSLADKALYQAKENGRNQTQIYKTNPSNMHKVIL